MLLGSGRRRGGNRTQTWLAASAELHVQIGLAERVGPAAEPLAGEVSAVRGAIANAAVAGALQDGAGVAQKAKLGSQLFVSLGFGACRARATFALAEQTADRAVYAAGSGSLAHGFRPRPGGRLVRCTWPTPRPRPDDSGRARLCPSPRGPRTPRRLPTAKATWAPGAGLG
jgi:hypothetical protein